jgi:puromycin-sensitive aminopeptidase
VAAGATTRGSRPHRCAVTVPGNRLTSFAADIGAHSLRHFERYFALPYPADKLDHLAIPDFASGAMENLGLITYREAALLVDPSTTSLEEQARVAETVAHEVSHMWFGDLVTMACGTDCG